MPTPRTMCGVWCSASGTLRRFAAQQHFGGCQSKTRPGCTRLKPFSACPDRRIQQHEQGTRWYGRSAEPGGGGPISLLGTGKPMR